MTGRLARVLVPALAIAVGATGCMARGGRGDGDQVTLATTRLVDGEIGCYPDGRSVVLIADGSYGTVVKYGPDDPSPQPLYWPAYYTASRVGSEIEVRDPARHVVALTGRSYVIYQGAYRGALPLPSDIAAQGVVTSGACISEIEDPTPRGLFVLLVICIALAAALLLVRRVTGKDPEATLPT